MTQLLAYRLYEDLRRGWRVIQPNLEQCGLLEIEYPGLKELCENEAKWAAHPVLQAASPECRYKVIYAFLDHLRREMAIDASVLDPAEEWDLRQRVQQNLRDPWAFDNDDIIRQSFLFVLPGTTGPEGFRDRTLGDRLKLGRFLRSRKTWDIQADIPTAGLGTIHSRAGKGAEREFLATHENTVRRSPRFSYWRPRFAGSEGPVRLRHLIRYGTNWMRSREGRGRRAQSKRVLCRALPRNSPAHVRG